MAAEGGSGEGVLEVDRGGGGDGEAWNVCIVGMLARRFEDGEYPEARESGGTYSTSEKQFESTYTTCRVKPLCGARMINVQFSRPLSHRV